MKSLALLLLALAASGAQAVAHAVLPVGVELVDKGDSGQSTESGKRMMAGIPPLFAVLVPAYGGCTLAGIAMTVLPLSAIGTVCGLLLFDNAMALPAILGIILLFSIIVKNSILMVDFIHHREKAGDTPLDAARDSNPLRYRPVLMTAFGSIAGMLPVALEHAVGRECLVSISRYCHRWIAGRHGAPAVLSADVLCLGVGKRQS